jgi:hypothetical protein
MNHDHDRLLIRQAVLDDVPPMAPDLEHRIERRLIEGSQATGEYGRRRLVPLIAAVAGLLVATLVLGTWLIYQRANPASAPAVAPGHNLASPHPTAVDPSRCRLPVMVMSEVGPPAQLSTEVGFVDTHTGKYTKDASASIAGLPGGGSAGTSMKPGIPAAPVEYSTPLGRWLPVGGPAISPDRRSYLWVQLLPAGSNLNNFQTAELHRYDVARATDRTLWTYAGSIDLQRWDADGILVNTVPPGGGRLIVWLVDPETGAATQESLSSNPIMQFTHLPGDPASAGSNGMDAQGRRIIRLGTRTKGDQEWVFYESTPGQRVTIYRGTQGDATGFDPFRVGADSTGLWFGDYRSSTMWHWNQKTGLSKITVTGVPAPIGGYPTFVLFYPAGLCS